MTDELVAQSQYFPELSQGDAAVNGDGDIIIIEDATISVVDGTVYYDYSFQGTTEMERFEAEQIDEEFEKCPAFNKARQG